MCIEYVKIGFCSFCICLRDVELMILSIKTAYSKRYFPSSSIRQKYEIEEFLHSQSEHLIITKIRTSNHRNSVNEIYLDE